MLNKKQLAIVNMVVAQAKSLQGAKYPSISKIAEAIGALEICEEMLKAECAENDPQVVAIDQLCCDLDAMPAH